MSPLHPKLSGIIYNIEKDRLFSLKGFFHLGFKFLWISHTYPKPLQFSAYSAKFGFKKSLANFGKFFPINQKIIGKKNQSWFRSELISSISSGGFVIILNGVIRDRNISRCGPERFCSRRHCPKFTIR